MNKSMTEIGYELGYSDLDIKKESGKVVSAERHVRDCYRLYNEGYKWAEHEGDIACRNVRERMMQGVALIIILLAAFVIMLIKFYFSCVV